MKRLSWGLQIIAEIVSLGIALGLMLAIAGLVAGYVMLGFFYLTA